MRLMDEIRTKFPFYGRPRIQHELQQQLGKPINHKRVHRLMKKMSIFPIYPKPKLSKGHPEHEKYPYLLRGLNINYPNHVWCTDITYLRMDGGFMYLVAVMDWYSRCILSWRLSNTMEVDFCLDALSEALSTYGTPEIFNTDQGVQFTSMLSTSLLKEHGIRISMDGKGRSTDNIMIERFWRSLKYEDIYLKAYSSVPDLISGVEAYMTFYNEKRPHSFHGNLSPAKVYCANVHTPYLFT